LNLVNFASFNLRDRIKTAFGVHPDDHLRHLCALLLCEPSERGRYTGYKIDGARHWPDTQAL